MYVSDANIGHDKKVSINQINQVVSRNFEVKIICEKIFKTC